MPAAYSKDLREKIVQAYINRVGSAAKIAKIFSVSKWVVLKYLRIYRKTRDLTPGKSTGRPPILSEADMQSVKDIVEAENDKTLQEYCEIVKNSLGIVLSKSTMENVLNRLDLRLKKKVSMQQSKIDQTYKKEEEIT